MKYNLGIKSVFSFLLFASSLQAQIAFEQDLNMLANDQITSGISLGVCDMDGDYLDDLIRLDDAQILSIEYQRPGNKNDQHVHGSINGMSWSTCAADINGDGFNDIITGGLYNGIKYLQSFDQGTTYLSKVLDGLIFMQASNFVDINNDGHTDYFVCDDDNVARPYMNDGDGNFSYQLNAINTSSIVPSDNSGNYGSIWTDYDNDGDMDLYLSKCRLGVADPMDGRRINMMFENDGLNNFTEVAEDIGLRPLTQSWNADFADIDNDGDLDVFLINHDVTSQVYENVNNKYIDITDTAFPSGSISLVNLGIQQKLVDFDNDGFLDLMITGLDFGHQLYRNNGDKTFSLTNGIDITDKIQSFAIGDLNNDGFLDIITGFANSYNIPSSRPDRVYINETNNNHWSKVTIEGTNSNYNGIGARVELHGSWGVQIREIRSGEAYGVMNSLNAYFGIGDATSIDELIVKWPSGKVSTISNPDIDQAIHVIEDFDCETTTTVAFAEICPDETIILEGEEQNMEGTYLDTLITAQGCDSIIQTFLSIRADIVVNQTATVCEGTPIQINGMPITVSGVYPDTLISAGGCDSIVNTTVNFLPKFDDIIAVDACEGDSVLVEGSYYYLSQTLNFSFSTINGCDSLITYELGFQGFQYDTQSISLCEGESILINGVEISESTTLIDTLPSGACYLIQTTEITVEEINNEISLSNGQLNAEADNVNYQWIDCDNGPITGATSQTYTPSNTGNYAVEIEYGNGCLATSDCIQVIIGAAADISQAEYACYPNPANDQIQLSEIYHGKKLDLNIFAMDGQVALHRSLGLYNGKAIDISELKSGLYLVHVNMGESNVSFKLIVID